MRYEVAEDGALSNGSVFFDMTDAPGDDALDGIKVDVEGNLYVCGPGGLWVLSPVGERLGLLQAPRGSAQPCVRRRRRQDAVHRRADQHLPDPARHRRHPPELIHPN